MNTLPTPDDVEPSAGDVVETIIPSDWRCDKCDMALVCEDSVRLGRCMDCRKRFGEPSRG